MKLWSSHDSSSPNRDATCTSHAARNYEASRAESADHAALLATGMSQVWLPRAAHAQRSLSRMCRVRAQRGRDARGAPPTRTRPRACQMRVQ